VIGGDGVNGAVHQARHAGSPVLLGAQGRVHAEIGVIVAHGFLGQQEMMRCDLGGDPNAGLLAATHRFDGPPGGDMSDMHAPAGEAGQADIAVHHDFFGLVGHAPQPQCGGDNPFVHDGSRGQRRLFTMVDDRHAEDTGVFQGPPHDLSRGNRLAVIGESHTAGVNLVAHLGQLLTGHSLGDTTDRVDADHSIPGSLGQYEPGHRLIIIDRRGVGHGRHRSEAAGRGRPGPGGDGFSVFASRFAQMNVHVDEAGGHPLAGHIQHPGIRCM